MITKIGLMLVGGAVGLFLTISIERPDKATGVKARATLDTSAQPWL